MNLNVNVPLSESTFQRVMHWAEARQQEAGEAIADYLTDIFSPDSVLLVPPAEPDPSVEREKAAYLQLHSWLKNNYAGQYVAIYEGKLVDYAEDYGTLFERIDDRYPDEFVWLTRVEEKPIGTLYFRSPRFLENN